MTHHVVLPVAMLALLLRISAHPCSAAPPEIKEPILFNTPEADAIVSQMQIFPADNSWNADVSKWPLHPNSQAILQSIGTDKPLRYNPDMAFVLAPPDQKRVEVKIVQYPDESDAGPFPVPDNLPIEGWPAHYQRHSKEPKPTLDDVQRDRHRPGGDRHGIVVDPTAGKLYEFFAMKRVGDQWQAAETSGRRHRHQCFT